MKNQMTKEAILKEYYNTPQYYQSTLTKFWYSCYPTDVSGTIFRPRSKIVTKCKKIIDEDKDLVFIIPPRNKYNDRVNGIPVWELVENSTKEDWI